jgi:hypothetical protein
MTNARLRSLKTLWRNLLHFDEPPGADPHAWRCGRGAGAIRAPMPLLSAVLSRWGRMNDRQPSYDTNKPRTTTKVIASRYATEQTSKMLAIRRFQTSLASVPETRQEMKYRIGHFVVFMFVQQLLAVTLQAQQLKLGELKLIYTEDEIPIRYDGSLSTLRKDGEMHFFHSFGCRLKTSQARRSRHSWHKGPPDDPLQCHVGSKADKELWDYNGYYRDELEKGIWILGMYECPSGDLLAITHAELNKAPNETRGRRAQQRFALGLGYSTDRGVSWTYCGEIVRPADSHHNVGGGAYIILADYIYVYFNDIIPGETGTRPTRIQCVARAELETVIRAAAQHQVTPWHKYRDGEWDIPGLSGKPGEDLIPDITGGEDLHADAAYCTALRKYLLTVQTHRAGKLLLFSSPDGLDWSLETTLDQVNNGAIQPYSSFVDFDGPSDDCHTVDGDFFIYFPRKGPDHDRDYLFRRRINID